MTSAPTDTPHSHTAQNIEKATLLLSDWNEEWIRIRNLDDAKPDISAAKWNKRAAHFKHTEGEDSYVKAFISLMNLQPEESVFDMGCGTGAIGLPLAKAGHPIVGRDISEGMLGIFQQDVERERAVSSSSIAPVDLAPMAWQDDWAAHGITPNMCDVAIASRSLITDDFRAALLQLTAVARRRVCVTFAAGSSPRIPLDLLREFGIHAPLAGDFIYAMNILTQEGYYPGISYITSEKKQIFENRTAARERIDEAFVSAAPFCNDEDLIAAQARVEPWLDAHLIPNPHAGMPDDHGQVQGAVMLDIPRTIRWAFISWDK